MRGVSRRAAVAMLAALCAAPIPWAAPAPATAPSWPPGPSPTRISWSGAFSSSTDLGLEARGLGAFLRQLIFGRQPEVLVRPYGVAVTGTGSRIAVADPGQSAAVVYDRAARTSRWIRDAGGRKLGSPIGVAFDETGRLFLSDSERREVMAFDPQLRLAWSLGPSDGLLRPTGIAARADRLYVVDTAANAVLVYQVGERGAEQRFRFGTRGTTAGTFNYPVDVAVSGDGIYVNDTMNFRIEAFDLEGRFLRAFGGQGDSSGHFQRPKGIAVDSDGNLYVADALADAVQIFDPGARFLMDFGEPGSSEGEFWLPAGVAIDGGDNIYVADSWNHRVQVFRYHGGDR